MSEKRRSLRTVEVPLSFQPAFNHAEEYVARYFDQRLEDPSRGRIEISGERYILVRAASMSKEFFDLVTSLYRDRGDRRARAEALSFLFDLAHAIGKADAKSFFTKMGVKDPIEKLSAGPVHFAYTGWAFVKIFKESRPTPDENYFLIYDHPFSFEADAWLKRGEKTDFPVCMMNAGYSSGWCEESFGVSLVAAEVQCRAMGDDCCRFIMAPPSRIKDHIARYQGETPSDDRDPGPFGIPEFFQRKRLEDELIKSEETVRALLNAPNDRAMLLDAGGKILALNKTAADTFGKRVEELIGRNAFDLLPETLSSRRKSWHEQVVRTGKPYRCEDRWNGRWMDTTVDPVRDAQGNVARVAVVSRDMTDYKRMEEALRKEKEFNATLIKTSPALFVAIDAKGRILLINEAMQKTLGYSHEEVAGKNYLKTFVPRSEWPFLKAVFRDLRGAGTTVNEGKMVTKDGRELIVEWHSRHILKEDGRLDYFLAIGVDVTERKRAEEELRRHRDHLEELVRERTDSLTKTNERLQREIAERKQAEEALKKSETMQRAIFDQTLQFTGVLKLDGTVLKVNKTAMDFIGARELEITGMPFWETPWWEQSEKERERLKRAVGLAAKGELVRFETTHAAADGRQMDIDFSLKPVRDDTGKILLLIAEGRDITPLKTAMRELRKSETRLKVQSKSLEEANIALKVLLKQVKEKEKEDKENILSNVKQLVIPYLTKLKKTGLDKGQMTLVEILETNLNSIVSPLVTRLSSTFLNLTPMEIRIAHLVKEGLTNKEMADLLGTSLNTVSSHRHSIRTKLGLKNNGTNLRSYLLSLENQ
ncbi:MAG: PAS domain S-box protein [Deltaproteobacteria bacterium]|nr:PAS domain S-box protein [Deltaproteobacteria bacterium]